MWFLSDPVYHNMDMAEMYDCSVWGDLSRKNLYRRPPPEGVESTYIRGGSYSSPPHRTRRCANAGMPKTTPVDPALLAHADHGALPDTEASHAALPAIER